MIDTFMAASLLFHNPEDIERVPLLLRNEPVASRSRNLCLRELERMPDNGSSLVVLNLIALGQSLLRRAALPWGRVRTSFDARARAIIDLHVAVMPAEAPPHSIAARSSRKLGLTVERGWEPWKTLTPYEPKACQR